MNLWEVIELGVYAAFLLLFAGVAKFIFYGFRIVIPVFVVFGISFLGRVFAILINESFGIFAPKPSGDLAIGLFQQANGSGLGEFIGHKFFIQLMVNFPGFSLIGPEMYILLTTNAFLTAAAAVLAHWYFWYIEKNSKAANFALIILSVFPAAVGFSIFGPRDPVIYFFVTLFIVAVLVTVARSGAARVLGVTVATASFLALGSLRIQMLPIVSVFPAFVAFLALRGVRFSNVYSRVAVMGVVSAAVGVASIVAVLELSRVVLQATLKQEVVLDVDDAVLEYADRRYQRQFRGSGFGAGSAILPQNIVDKLPVGVRFAVQIIGMIILPAPWLITNFERLLAFTDTLFVLGLLILLWRHQKYLHGKEGRCALALVVAFFVGVVLLGIIITNAGNAFRMRLSLIPFLVFAATYVMMWMTSKSRTTGFSVATVPRTS